MELRSKEKENETSKPIDSWKAPIKIWMKLPDTFNFTEEITAVQKDMDGTEKPLEFTLDVETGEISFVLTGNKTVTWTQEKGETPEKVYYVHVDDDLTGGSLIVNPTSGKEGTKVTVTAKPDKGYKLKEIYVNEEAVQADKNQQYTFVLKEDTDVSAEFIRKSTHHSSSSDGSSSSSSPSFSWKRNARGWKLLKDDGTYAANEWQYVNGQWYHFDQSAYMETGWIIDNNRWYYLQADGSMKTGWFYSDADKSWYYLHKDGAMACGWIYVNEKWYYLSNTSSELQPYGSLLTNTRTPDNYQVNESGEWIGK